MWVGREAEESLPARADDQSNLSTRTHVLVARNLITQWDHLQPPALTLEEDMTT